MSRAGRVCASERKQAVQFVVDDATTSSTMPPQLYNFNKHVMRYGIVLHFSILLHWRNDKSELDKSGMFTFDLIPFFGCLILDFLIFFLVYETPYD